MWEAAAGFSTATAMMRMPMSAESGPRVAGACDLPFKKTIQLLI